MNNEKFARENKRIIEGMVIGAIAGPIVFLVLMYFKNPGPLQIWQIFVSIALGIVMGLTTTLLKWKEILQPKKKESTPFFL